MQKEVANLRPIEIQQRLYGKLCGRGIEKRTEQARNGHLPNGLTLAELSESSEGFTNILGDFAPRVLIASNPNNPLTLIPEQIAIAGGWCALRTKDVANLSQQGIIMNPKSGSLDEVKSVDQVALWIAQSVTFDQIIESVGAVRGAEYAVISERRLWTERITTKLSQILNRRLTVQEQYAIERSVEQAEMKRAIMTKRYIQSVTGNENVVFQRIVDDDIWTELNNSQKEMFSRIGLTIDSLERMFPANGAIIQSSSLVWTMYSEPYFDALRKKGLIAKKTVFIAEPSLHTYADNQAGSEVVSRTYQDKGVYFDPKGMNSNTGFIAFIECVTQDGINVRKNLGVGGVPNISNWEQLFNGELDPERNSVVNPKDNRLFLWGVNFLPFGSTRQSLLRLVDIQDEFQKQKTKIATTFSKNGAKKDPSIRGNIQVQIDSLRQEFSRRIQEENSIIASNLKQLFAFLTKDLEKTV